MPYKFVWLVWAGAFLLPWVALYIANPGRRRIMLRSSAVTSLFGLTEPLFVPEYWNPPTLFDLAQRTGFDIESLVFCFAIGGIGVVLYDAFHPRPLATISHHERARHRYHRAILAAPFVLFVPLLATGWNPIYPGIVSLAVGAVGAMFCRPDLAAKTAFGGLLFLGLYAVFMAGLRVSSPGYIEAVWRLDALSGIGVAGIPLEELLFAVTFGMYWSSAYEHVTWHRHTPLASGG